MSEAPQIEEIKTWKVLIDQVDEPSVIIGFDGFIIVANLAFEQSELAMLFKQLIEKSEPLQINMQQCLDNDSTVRLQLLQSFPVEVRIQKITEGRCLLKFRTSVVNKFVPEIGIFHYRILGKNTLSKCVAKNDFANRIWPEGSLADMLAQNSLNRLLSGTSQNQTFFRQKTGGATFFVNACIIGGKLDRFLSLQIADFSDDLLMNNRLISAFKNSRIPFFVANSQGLIDYFNESFENKLGLKGQEWSQSLQTVRNTSVAEKSRVPLWDEIKQAKVWEGEIGFSLPSGEQYWALYTVSPVIENGAVLFYTGYEHTAKEVYSVLDQLKNHYSFLDGILDSLDYPFTVYDPSNYAVIHENKSAKQFKGKLSCKMNGGGGKPYCEACLLSEVNYCLLEEVYSSQTVLTREFEFQTKDEILFYELSVFPVFSGADIVGLIQTARDVTDRKKLEITEHEDKEHRTEAERQKTLLASVINSIPDHIFYKDSNGSYFGSNTAFLDLAGVSSVDGKKDFDLFPKELAYYYSLQDQLVLKKDIPARSEKWVKFPDGRRALFDTLRVPFKFNGETVGVIGISRDVTDFKRIEKEILEQKEKIVRRNEEIEKQKDEIELQRDFVTRQNLEITQSINYALRIQNAVLPQRDEIDAILDDHFIFFQPRNIVSGDFYWFSKVGNTVYVAAADCTGHGVPGALMSILGVAFLKQVVTQLNGGSTGEILNQLRKYIILSLHQTGKEGETSDGLDIALYSVNLDNLKLEFSGAYNPLFLVRDKKLIEFKGDKMPISLHAIKSEFTTQKIQLRSGDAIYVFSDGFVDQFGGRNDKKLKRGIFKRVVKKYSSKSMDKQGLLFKRFFNSWKGSREQVDDILLIGARF